MEKLNILATEKTPAVNFDPEQGNFEIAGKSVPEDAEDFYKPILLWLEDYLAAPADKTVLILNLEYFNISSSKRILFILYKFNELTQRNCDVKVKWFFDNNDEDMYEVGQDYEFMVRVPFEFVGVSRGKEATAVA
jgi:hypothetical protein